MYNYLTPTFAAIASALIIGLAAPLCSAATASAATPQVKAELLAATNAVEPGESLRLAVHQHIIPHWHTYWINPGDSGLATTIAWTLPEGARAGDIDWPTPSRFKFGPVTNYGYENEVTLLSTLGVPDTLKPGDQFRAKATVDCWSAAKSAFPSRWNSNLACRWLPPAHHARAETA